eukprot:Plantae.Rhodophyta-Hildenbrandia_rubra.ctg4657.p1 GENE.Plantae.Rhodophyta-Hildenbrandia_rubra.ctg4657~~Plantae.Rhodophyta-Hildenbrandia_rubra.ctg4657.p1  ORF type:complete len:319 (-),score=87.73 Plantae.Rhodophyta-Hildenbrandia_rubra.ctg4657:2885-3841(-)
MRGEIDSVSRQNMDFDGELPSIPRVNRKPSSKPSPSQPTKPSRPHPETKPRAKVTPKTKVGTKDDHSFAGKRKRVVADLESTESEGEGNNANGGSGGQSEVGRGREKRRKISDEISDEDEKVVEKGGTNEGAWSDMDAEENETPSVKSSEGQKGEGRLTRRQRAMRGDASSAAEMGLLLSPWKKKKRKNSKWKSDDDDEEVVTEESRAEKRRLRNMVNEKKNREKRAAAVDRVLRGATTKKKKGDETSKSVEESARERLIKNEPRKGCARHISKNGITTISFCRGDPVPAILSHRQTHHYPPKCTRDPKTGKRIFATT